MRRWIPIGAVAAVVSILILLSTIPTERFVQREKPQANLKLRIYTDIQTSTLQLIADIYQQQKDVEIEIIHMSDSQLIDTLDRKLDVPDMVWGSELLLRTLQQKKLLAGYRSEETDLVEPVFKAADDSWVGVWYQPIVWVVGDEYYRKHGDELYVWDDLYKQTKAKLAMTDFVAADLSAELLYSMVTLYGEDKAFSDFRSLHQNVDQYGQYLSTPVRLVATGRSDIAIADAGTAREYIMQGYPIHMIYPQDGTAYYLYGAAIASGAYHQEEAGKFIDWFLNGNAFIALQRKQEYIYYTGLPSQHVSDAHGDQPVLWKINKGYTQEGEKELLAKWVHDIRFAKEG